MGFFYSSVDGKSGPGMKDAETDKPTNTNFGSTHAYHPPSHMFLLGHARDTSQPAETRFFLNKKKIKMKPRTIGKKPWIMF